MKAYRQTHALAAALLIALGASATANARPEGYVSIYGGWGATGNGTIEGSATDYTYTGINFIGPVYNAGDAYSVQYDYDSDSGPLVGTRAGMWFSGSWKNWGFAGDLSRFSIGLEPYGGSINVVPFSSLLLYRLPLQISDDFPGGRLQPYGGVGLAMVLGRISIPGLPEINDAGGLGGSLHAGCMWKLNPSLGIFVEYRYLRANLNGMNDDEINHEVQATEVDVDTSISAHHILSGISFFF